MVEDRWIYRGQDGRMCGFFSPEMHFPSGTHHLELARVYSAEEHAEVEKLRALYRACSEDDDPEPALYALDGGTYNKKIAGEA